MHICALDHWSALRICGVHVCALSYWSAIQCTLIMDCYSQHVSGQALMCPIIVQSLVEPLPSTSVHLDHGSVLPNTSVHLDHGSALPGTA